MINNLAIHVITLAVGLGALPSALSVCPDRQIGIGHDFSLAGGAYSVIRANNCGIIADRSAAVDKDNICGSYNHGATVQCNAGTQIPNTAQTGDGTNWGNCHSTNESCGVTDVQNVHFCCSRNGLFSSGE
ncbi:hypothetical protein JB92DRAFT_2905563 [Gautieria morchelliformis]|nr:hypothetical protein JB92DRAFT_2905563 [Gautieria morchelliformis]